MSDPRCQLVAAGYDLMIDTWEVWRAQITEDPRGIWCAELLDRLPAGSRVVELGCGGGTAETRALAERFQLTAVDLSSTQLRRARARVPGADYLLADLTTVELPRGSLDAVAAFYVLNHVPRELLAPLFRRVHAWLRPGGLFLARSAPPTCRAGRGISWALRRTSPATRRERTGSCVPKPESRSFETRSCRSASRRTM